jgi:hypothetical protein
MGATVKDTAHLCAMTYDLTATVGAFGCQRVDGALKTVEDMRLTIQSHLKTFVVFVFADLTLADTSIASEYIRGQAFCCFHQVLLICSLILFRSNSLRLFDIFAPRPRLSGCRLLRLRNFFSWLGFEPISNQMDRLGAKLLDDVPGILRVWDKCFVLNMSVLFADQPLDRGPVAA